MIVTQVMTILVWTFFEFLLLKAAIWIAPTAMRTLVEKLLPPEPPPA